MFLITQCKPADTGFDYSNFNKITKRGAFELYVPKYLHQDKKLNPKAAIAFSDSLNNTFFMVIREEIPDTEDDSIVITSENYHQFACEGIAAQLKNPDISHGEPDTVNLFPVLNSTIDGKYDAHKIYYIVTTIKTELYFYQLIGWTLYENKATVGNDLFYIAKSFIPAQ